MPLEADLATKRRFAIPAAIFCSSSPGSFSDLASEAAGLLCARLVYPEGVAAIRNLEVNRRLLAVGKALGTLRFRRQDQIWSCCCRKASPDPRSDMAARQLVCQLGAALDQLPRSRDSCLSARNEILAAVPGLFLSDPRRLGKP
jgi:hypothetical protein